MRARILVAFVLLLVGSAAMAGEQWYVFTIGETPVGYFVDQRDGLRTRTELYARLTRLGKSVEMRFETVSVESADGYLRSLTYVSHLSKQPTRLEKIFEGDGPLGPIAIGRLTADRLRHPGDVIEYSIFSPELQRVANVRRTLVGEGRVEESIEGLPATRVLWLDAGGQILGDEVPGPFGPMRTTRSTRAAALAANGTLPADVYERTLARSNIRFADPFAIDRVVLRVRRTDSTQPLPSLESHNQTVLRRDTESVDVEVRRSGGVAENAGEYLAANALIESNDPEILKIANELKRGDPRSTAYEMTRWVAENMSMDAGIVMAPASELIRDRRATCMGYATLLAALARAGGIPSRIAMGLVYYGGIWGGHAWTEAILDGRWTPLDAAVYAPGPAGAARLAAGTSSMADGGGDLHGALGAMFGRVAIDVLAYDVGGRTLAVTPDTAPYRAARQIYSNPGLGLRIPADGWTIERADSTWPSPVVVAFRRGEHVVELRHQPRYPERALKREGDDALYAEARGGMLWIWSARGPDAGRVLRHFVQ